MSKCSIAVAALLGALAFSASDSWAQQTLWKFNNLERIGGFAPKVEGHPALVDSPVGKAVDFNGVDDALFFPGRPLVGAKAFSIEVIFKPEGGALEQRFMHIAETDPATGLDAASKGTSDTNPRFMFEIRVKDGVWWLDAFVNSKAGSKALIDPAKSHPVGAWYAVEQTYDGKTYRSYVNGVLENEAEVPFTPHGPGHMMVGVRMNHVNYFHGAIAQARFSTRALRPGEFMKVAN
jgi:Concanavalin A-like lectin/glucanases superfamily